MKPILSIISIIGVLIFPAAVIADCSPFYYTEEIGCYASGGVVCPPRDGCWACCKFDDDDYDPSLPLCEGSYLEINSETFSDAIGSGYLIQRRYTTACVCQIK